MTAGAAGLRAGWSSLERAWNDRKSKEIGVQVIIPLLGAAARLSDAESRARETIQRAKDDL